LIIIIIITVIIKAQIRVTLSQ